MAAQKKTTNINLVIKEDTEDTLSNQFLAWALSWGRYIIILTQIVVLTVFFMRFKLDRDHTDLKESVTQKQALIESLSDLENEVFRIQKRLSDIKKIAKNDDAVPQIITFLQQNTPTDIRFSVISYSKENIKLIAEAPSLKSFNFFLSKIQGSNYFSDVSLDTLNRSSNDTVEFQINAKINIESYE